MVVNGYIMRVDYGYNKGRCWVCFDGKHVLKGTRRQSMNTVMKEFIGEHGPRNWTKFSGINRPSEFAMTAASIEMEAEDKAKKVQ